MEIIKTNNGTRYRESVYLNGKKHHSPCFLRKSDAKEWKMKFLNHKYDVLAGREKEGSRTITFTEFATQWLEKYKKHELTETTYDSYSGILRKHLIPHLEGKKMRDVREEDGHSLVQKLKENGHNAGGINNILKVMKSIFIKARKTKVIIEDPFEELSKQKRGERMENFWSKSEVEQFLSANKEDCRYPLYYVAIHTGMRMAELTGLKWDRVDFFLEQIKVTRIRGKRGIQETTKTGNIRTIPMTPGVRNLLLELKAERAKTPYVFTDFKGDEISYGHLYRDFKNAQKKAGIENMIRFHDLRHTFASQFMMNGGDIFHLQKLLGHTKMETTMIYAHFSPDHLRGAIPYMFMGAEEESRPDLDQSPFKGLRLVANN